MKITLHIVKHYGGKYGNEMQVQARIARHIHDDAETERLTQTLVNILQEGARENFIRLYLKNDPYSREPNDTPPLMEKNPIIAALKARLHTAESQAKAWRKKYEELARKLMERKC